MGKRHDPERIDNENPEWRAEDFARARPAGEVLGEIFGEEMGEEMSKPRPDRPAAARTKEQAGDSQEPK
ncbi:hypothetical protein [Metapseudomonas resinovorans]|uniref:Uncharacterized protein n=1 Tax=Metapseudomonas resinovorans NBRC 106553 TaxID=1245471 RepID=S6AU65_METRE|nr:hypothetical protein [Pseudomonas resinovorans]BAN47821.1 hypothetical protein PCA10_20890 [Pseudomonas resinovorans NBRC 106553]